MARRVRNIDLETRESRRKLKVRGKPYWAAIGLGLHLGYRKGRRNGMWVARKYLGGQTYKLTTIALADDIEDADGAHVLSFWQAQDLARNMRTPRSGPYTVKQAVDDYLKQTERPRFVSRRGRAYASACAANICLDSSRRINCRGHTRMAKRTGAHAAATARA